ncbi:hypothetical protein BDD12DRAFT_869932 [Trichophaea hybrida]|nr:hypothetical protein BDD12DRAFT_869932 [Trichophaea hybrida]
MNPGFQRSFNLISWRVMCSGSLVSIRRVSCVFLLNFCISLVCGCILSLWVA